MRILLVLNGPRRRYSGGADAARQYVWREYCAAGTDLEIGYLPDEKDSGGISRSYEFGTGEAAVKHAQLYPDRCVEAEREGFDAVIMHCCSDPGLYDARKRVGIPVVGPGEATFQTGAIVGSSIGITVPSDASVAHHWRQVRDVGIQPHVIGLEPVNSPIGEYSSQDPEAMTDSLVAAAQRLVDRGADVICPTGLALIPIRVSASEVTKRIGVPVLDPAFLAVRRTETLVAALRHL